MKHNKATTLCLLIFSILEALIIFAAADFAYSLIFERTFLYQPLIAISASILIYLLFIRRKLQFSESDRVISKGNLYGISAQIVAAKIKGFHKADISVSRTGNDLCVSWFMLFVDDVRTNMFSDAIFTSFEMEDILYVYIAGELKRDNVMFGRIKSSKHFLRLHPDAMDVFRYIYPGISKYEVLSILDVMLPSIDFEVMKKKTDEIENVFGVLSAEGDFEILLNE